jgi:hypothetical protein
VLGFDGVCRCCSGEELGMVDCGFGRGMRSGNGIVFWWFWLGWHRCDRAVLDWSGEKGVDGSVG